MVVTETNVIINHLTNDHWSTDMVLTSIHKIGGYLITLFFYNWIECLLIGNDKYI